MRILTVTKHRAPEPCSFVPHESCNVHMNQLFNEDKSTECNSGLHDLRAVFVSIEARKKIV